jgi:excisionase family DNA binding protein
MNEASARRVTEPLVYSVVEAARALSTTEAAVRNMIQSKKLAALKVGRRVLIPHESVLDYLRARIVR